LRAEEESEGGLTVGWGGKWGSERPLHLRQTKGGG